MNQEEIIKLIEERIKELEGSEVDCYDCFINMGEIITKEFNDLLDKIKGARHEA